MQYTRFLFVAKISDGPSDLTFALSQLTPTAATARTSGRLRRFTRGRSRKQTSTSRVARATGCGCRPSATRPRSTAGVWRRTRGYPFLAPPPSRWNPTAPSATTARWKVALTELCRHSAHHFSCWGHKGRLESSQLSSSSSTTATTTTS